MGALYPPYVVGSCTCVLSNRHGTNILLGKYTVQTPGHIFSRCYNTPERKLRFMDQWNSVSVTRSTSSFSSQSLEWRIDYLIQRPGKLRLNLKEFITEFQHKLKILDKIMSAQHLTSLNCTTNFRCVTIKPESDE